MGARAVAASKALQLQQLRQQQVQFMAAMQLQQQLMQQQSWLAVARAPPGWK